MKRIELTIDGMSCGHCVSSVKKALEGAPGVEVEAVDIGAATVSYDEQQVEPAQIAGVVGDAGFPAEWRTAAGGAE